jgi:TolB-like protein
MVTEKGQAKIMDFGLARVSGTTLLTKEGSTMGTIAYMSPEQARGQEVDFRTDIWSLGVVLYEMFGGQLPFKGERDQSVVYSILNEKPKPITDLRSEIPMSIGQVVSKALEKNPDERAILYAGSAGFVIIMIVLGLSLFTGPAEAIDSIAVLPLKNLTGDSEQEYFVDGVTDELIGQLAQISGLRRVISRTSVMQYKDTDKPLPDIARELNVDALVEGTVYQVGENISIKLQLFDALPEERSLWIKRYDRPVTDVLVMYNEMARTIAENIQVKLTAQDETRLAGARQVNPEAYDAYLKGMFHWQRVTLEDLEAALQYFESALEKDPDFALAHAGIGLFWVWYVSVGIVPANEAAPKAVAAAERAMELDDTLAEAHYGLAVIRYVVDWDWEKAEASFRKAIELNPNYPDVRGYYAQFLFNMHRPDEAIVQMERALELDPFNSMFQYMYGMDLVFMRRYDEAIEQLQKTLKIVPNHAGATNVLAQVFHLKGMFENAYEQIKVDYESMDFEEGIKALTRGYEKAGYQGAMRSAAEMWEELAKVTYVLPWNIAQVYAYAGNKEKTLDWLEKGVEVRDPNMLIMGVVPLFVDLLGDEPRYQDLLRKMNLPVNEKE